MVASSNVCADACARKGLVLTAVGLSRLVLLGTRLALDLCITTTTIDNAAASKTFVFSSPLFNDTVHADHLWRKLVL